MIPSQNPQRNFLSAKLSDPSSIPSNLDSLIIKRMEISRFSVHLALIFMVSMPISLLSFSPQPESKIPTLSSQPAALTNSPPVSSLSPLQDQLSPDIAPLLPSPGGVLPTPTGSDIPTIPSSPSPPNPDDMIAPGPFSAMAPMQASSNALPSPFCNSAMAVFASLAAFWSMNSVRM